MDTAPSTDPGAWPVAGAVPDIFGLEDIQDRYRIGRTRAVDLCATDAFPRSVVPGMHRYPVAAVEAWELSFSLHGTVAEPARAAPVLVTPPAPRRPGRRPATSGDAR